MRLLAFLGALALGILLWLAAFILLGGPAVLIFVGGCLLLVAFALFVGIMERVERHLEPVRAPLGHIRIGLDRDRRGRTWLPQERRP